MKKTENYNYNLPELEDRVKIRDFNQNTENIDTDITELKIALETKANIDSPRFIGEPTAPKVTTLDADERIATVSTVKEVINLLEVIEL